MTSSSLSAASQEEDTNPSAERALTPSVSPTSSSSTYVVKHVSARLPTYFGDYVFSLYGLEHEVDGSKMHCAMVFGDVRSLASSGKSVLVRVHSECFTGDVMGSMRCDCGEQLVGSLKMIQKEGVGVLVYLRQEGRGIGLLQKMHAYNLQDQGYDTVDANVMLGHAPDKRNYEAAAHILRSLSVTSVRLLTNNPEKVVSLNSNGINVATMLPLAPTAVSPDNIRYLLTKVARMNHTLSQNSLRNMVGESPPLPHKTSHMLGVDVDVGLSRSDPVLAAASKTMNSVGEGVWRPRRRLDSPAWRPHVTLTYAQSLDGSIGTATGCPLTLSCTESMTMTHSLRASHNAILVGVGTVLSDRPRLSVRLCSGRHPRPVVLDSMLRTPIDSPFITAYQTSLKRNIDSNSVVNSNSKNISSVNSNYEHPQPWILCSIEADMNSQIALEAAGARVVRCATTTIYQENSESNSTIGKIIDLREALHIFRREGISSLMVEGGARVIKAFLTSRFIDELIVTISPSIIGGISAVSSNHNEHIKAKLPALNNVSYKQCGCDMIMRAVPTWNNVTN